jgi:predicted enzyme related to lactoylglutathione lyase
VADVDATTAAARAAGATVEREPTDMPYGFRTAAVIDPFGHRWLLETPLAGAVDATGARSSAATPERPKPRTAREVTDEHEVYTEPGDIVYVTWQVPDEQRTARFLGELLGWTFTPGNVEHGLGVEGPNLMGGLWGKGEGTPIDAKLMYHVADIQTAVDKVRELGGTATDPELMPYGWSADCADDQGMEFWLYTPAEG